MAYWLARRAEAAPGTGLADALTASRWVVAASLAFGRPSPVVAVLLVAWAWVSDAVDGPLARAAGHEGRLGGADHVTDAAVGLAVVWYLGELGAVPPLPSRVVALVLLALWWVTGVMAAQMSLQALAFGAFLLWTAQERVPGRSLLVVLLAVLGVVEWRRLVGELVPRFLRGWREILTGRGGNAAR